MSQSSLAFQLVKDAEPIPGYVLQERIGVGGCGEVWKAIAPGGLTKAVKVIYGHFEDRRAAAEIKSLNRVKELSHPFLLNLERIEIVDGHLVIVTELADLNLKERFDHHRETGLQGIPRDEMLTYLGEAADALDYLAGSHSLQHLDVKPENMLLVGRHVKVADFGLLKDLRDISVSLVNGLTPRYAAPEMFDGRPSRQSDQYGLAIVYKEMLTGELPFDGRTAATLASQHLHAAPDLSGLTPQERFAVGKALSKDPQRRFESCFEFVERLMQRSSATIISETSENSSPRYAKDRDHLHTSGHTADGAGRPANVHDGHTIVVTRPEVTSLDAPDIADSPQAYRPTIFVGLGGTGGAVLGRLRQLMTDRFGDLSACPALQFLFIDTNVKAITQAASCAGGGALREREMLALPLRRAWDYRQRAVSNLGSISRRWLYNIPRSQQTEGLRALGRLALLDNCRRALDRLRSAVLATVDDEAISSTGNVTGLPFQKTDPRVFLVASVAGGTGGGMMLDVGYALRQILAETGLVDDDICALLTYSTPTEAGTRSLAPANACVCLDELEYFSLPGNDYPGEPACGLAGFSEDASPFKSTYLFDFGDHLSDAGFTQAVDRLSRYLMLNSVSPASSFFDACRRIEREDRPSGQLCIRTAGLAPLGADNCTVGRQWVESLCHSVVRNWRGGVATAAVDDRIKLSDYNRVFEACDAAAPSDDPMERLAADHAARLELAPQRLADRLLAMIHEELGSNVGNYLQDIAAKSVDKALAVHDDTKTAVTGTLRMLHAILGIEEDADAELGGQIQTLRELTASKALELGGAIGNSLKDWILERVDHCDSRVAGARRVVEWFNGYFQTLQADGAARVRSARADRTSRRAQIIALCSDPKRGRRVKRKVLVDGLHGYVDSLIKELVLEGAFKTTNSIQPSVTAAGDQLRDLWKDINRLCEEFQVSTNRGHEAGHTTTTDTSPAAAVDPVEAVFAEHRLQMIGQLDRRLDEGFFLPERRLRHVLLEGSRLRAEFITYMRSAARNVILDFAKQATLSRLNESLSGTGTDGLKATLLDSIEAATPKLMTDAGGAKRLLLVAPADSDTSRLEDEVRQASQEEPALVRAADGNVLLCYEVEQLPLERITTRFIRSRPDCQELATRLHNRIDVKW